MLFSSSVRVRIRIRFSVWLVNGYAHVFVPLSVVIVTLPIIALSADQLWSGKLVYPQPLVPCVMIT